MSWLEKLLPPKIQQTDPTERRRCPKACGSSARAAKRCCTRPTWSKTRTSARAAATTTASARARGSNAFLDAEGRYEIGQEVLPVDALKFKDSRKYPERLKEALENTGETDALVVMGGAVHSISLVAACFEFDFMGGSMGSVVGERFVRGVETAIEQKVPFLCFTATGGARMQEGLLSLMQMAKTNAALTRLAKKGLPYISVLTDPTMGGVSAGFAFVGDVVIAEPKALIGFAGPRVIESTVRVTLPEGFQRAEFLQTKGAVDFICDRRELRKTVASTLAMLQRQPADAVESDCGRLGASAARRACRLPSTMAADLQQHQQRQRRQVDAADQRNAAAQRPQQRLAQAARSTSSSIGESRRHPRQHRIDDQQRRQSRERQLQQAEQRQQRQQASRRRGPPAATAARTCTSTSSQAAIRLARSQRLTAGTTRRSGSTIQSVSANTNGPSGLPNGTRWYCMYSRSRQAPPSRPTTTSSRNEMIW